MDHGITTWASAGGVSSAGASTASAPSTVPPSLMVSRGEERSGLTPGFISTTPVSGAVSHPRMAVARACCHQPSRAVARPASEMWFLGRDRGAGAEADGCGALGEAALPVRCARHGGEVSVLAPGHAGAGGVGRLRLGLELGVDAFLEQ